MDLKGLYFFQFVTRTIIISRFLSSAIAPLIMELAMDGISLPGNYLHIEIQQLHQVFCLMAAVGEPTT
jgi:hypothetical protein